VTRKAMLVTLQRRVEFIEGQERAKALGPAARDRALAEAAAIRWALTILVPHVERERAELGERADKDRTTTNQPGGRK
jgi:hypothetical protein